MSRFFFFLMELYKENELTLFCSKHSLYLYVALFPTFPSHALLTNVYLFVILVILLTYIYRRCHLYLCYLSVIILYILCIPPNHATNLHVVCTNKFTIKVIEIIQSECKLLMPYTL